MRFLMGMGLCRLKRGGRTTSVCSIENYKIRQQRSSANFILNCVHLLICTLVAGLLLAVSVDLKKLNSRLMFESRQSHHILEVIPAMPSLIRILILRNREPSELKAYGKSKDKPKDLSNYTGSNCSN